MRATIPLLLLPLLPALLLAAPSGCSSKNDTKGEGEGEGEGEQPDGGAVDGTTDGTVSDAAQLDVGAPDEGSADSGVDPWEHQVKKKDGISAKVRAPANPKLSLVYTVPIGEGSTRRLCFWVGAAPDDPQAKTDCFDLHIGIPSNPYLSADGDWVAFYEAGGTQLLLGELPTKVVSTIGSVGGADEYTLRNPVISGGASYVAFQKAYQGATHIARLDRTKTPNEDLPIWEQNGSAGTPSISDDGSKIVFHSDPGGNNEVWLWDAQVRDTVNLTKTQNLHEKDPRISANGDVICYRSSAQSEGRVGQIFVASNNVHRDITSEYSLTYLNNWDCQPSSTGRHVVFRSLPGQYSKVEWLKDGFFYIYDLNADEHRQLPEPAGVDRDKAFSPWRLSSDGRWIAFTAWPTGGSGPDLFLLDVVTGHTVRLTHSAEALGTGAPAIN